MIPAANRDRLFPAGLAHNEWATFDAEGFSAPACGVLYHSLLIESWASPVYRVLPANGVPLGGIDTGCIDLDADGTLGFCTIFNSLVNRRGPLRLPFLSLAVGDRTWLLASNSIPDYVGTRYWHWTGGRRDLHMPEAIEYWGHYPVADLEYQITGPVSIGLRAWSPFVPGDTAASLIPAAFFDVHLRNTSSEEQAGTVAFSFPGPSRDESEDATLRGLEIAERSLRGLCLESGNGVSYALLLVGEDSGRVGGELGLNMRAWAETRHRLPDRLPGEPGASLAFDFRLSAGQRRTVSFLLAWHAPYWESGGAPRSGGNRFRHMYATRFGGALDVARSLVDRGSSLLSRILAWQQAIYQDDSLPVWLREGLVNNFHFITEDGLWAAAEPPIGGWCRPENGLFGMNECPRGCPQMECLPCSYFGNYPILLFFPDLALSTLRGYKAYQYPDGAPPWVFGGATADTPPCEMAIPARGYQHPLNGPCYVDLVNRYWLRTGDEEFLREFYDSVKRATVWTMNLRSDLGRRSLIAVLESEPPMKEGHGQDWFEACEFFGMTAHVAGIRLAHLEMAEQMARRLGDEEFRRQCRSWIDDASQMLETELWAGEYYLHYSDPDHGRKSDLVFAHQLDGEWMARQHGLPSVFRSERINATLATIARVNVPLTKYGAVAFARPDGTSAADFGYGAYAVVTPTLLMLAMTYLYTGQVAFGLELVRRHWHDLVCEKGYAWDQPNMLRGDKDSGEAIAGHDYYQNGMLWALPAAIEGKDLRGFVRSGGLVDRVIAAGKA